MIHRPRTWLLPALLPLLVVTACTRTPDETLIRQQLDQLHQAVQDRKPREVIAHLTDDFRAQDRMGVKEVRQFMLAQFFRNKQINILVTGLKVTVESGTGTARVSFRAAASGGADWLPERADYFQVDSVWRKQGDDWRVHRLSWKPVLAS